MDNLNSSEGGAQPESAMNRLSHPSSQSYFDKSAVVRLLIGLFFAAVLFFFLHYRESYTETLELGSPAGRTIVAQMDFAFPDEEATIIQRQDAARAIGTIWRINGEQLAKRCEEYKKTATQDGQEGSSDPKPLCARLLESRFADSKTVAHIEQIKADKLPVSIDCFYPFVPPQEQAHLPASFWDSLPHKETLPPELVKFFSSLSWEFEKDLDLEYSLRKLVQAGVAEVYTPIKGGERLIDQGEKVGLRHLAMLQAMKEKLNEKKKLFTPMTVAGSVLLTVLFAGVAALYLKENHHDIFYSNRRLALLGSILILALAFAKAVEFFWLKSPTRFLDSAQFPLLVPMAAILLGCLMNVRIAAFASIFLTVIYSIALAVDATPFVVVNIVTSIVAIMTGRALRRRKDVFVVCAKAWGAAVLVILSFELYSSKGLGFFIIGDILAAFLFMAATAVIVVGLLPMLESIFRIMTDITLMEFMDPGNVLLKRLTIEAPGTYQHSMVVGHLAEAAAGAIGANGLFCRVATQYHDIGKLNNPQYFTENQLGGIDMHQLLTPLESAQVIIAHVSGGVALARKVGLPEQFIDIIKEHHGTTLVYYFYHKQIELMERDKTKVDETDFRYFGPKPRSKESTIIMIADTLEAASRSLDLFNESTVTALVESLIAHKMEDGQFDESLLTFEELGIVKTTIVKTLMAASHPRVKYPMHHPGEEG